MRTPDDEDEGSAAACLAIVGLFVALAVFVGVVKGCVAG